MSMWRWLLRPICWRRGHADPIVLSYDALPFGWLLALLGTTAQAARTGGTVRTITDPGGWKASTAATDPEVQRSILLDRLVERSIDPAGLDRDALRESWENEEPA